MLGQRLARQIPLVAVKLYRRLAPKVKLHVGRVSPIIAELGHGVSRETPSLTNWTARAVLNAETKGAA